MCGFFYVHEEHPEVDYTKWLGKDYPKPKNVVTFIGNHSSYMDSIYMVWRAWPAFVAKIELRTVPIFGQCMVAMRTLFLDRSS